MNGTLDMDVTTAVYGGQRQNYARTVPFQRNRHSIALTAPAR